MWIGDDRSESLDRYVLSGLHVILEPNNRFPWLSDPVQTVSPFAGMTPDYTRSDYHENQESEQKIMCSSYA